MTMFSPEETARYSRHFLLPEVGREGQQRLKESSVLLIGAGGLGSPLALYLAAAGVGRLGLVDFDAVDLSNLQRQILHGTPDVGRPKLDSAQDRLREINPHVQLDLHSTRFTAENAQEIARPYDVLIDGTDNFPTRYLANDVSVMLGKPNVYGSIFRFEGQVSVFGRGGPCYRCVYPEPPPAGMVPNCAEGGVLGVLPGVVGCLQATEALKLLLGIGTPLRGRLLLFDALRMRFDELRIARDPNCAVCGDHPTLTELVQYEEFCTPDDIGLEHVTDQRLLDVRELWEWEAGHLPGALHIPLGELEQRLGELDAAQRWVVYCQSGGRSARACELLQQRGFREVQNLRGGYKSARNSS